MSVKAQLKIVLLANEVVVAESEDAVLWQQILQRLQAPAMAPGAAGGVPPALEASSGAPDAQAGRSSDAATEFARFLGVPEEAVRGACDPSPTPPLLQLNHHNWESLKKATPLRGPGAVPPATLAATLLVLWCQSAKLAVPSKSDINSVLATIGLQDKNPDRSLRNCNWLQVRGSHIYLNPAETSKAIDLASAYCLKTSPKRQDEA
jgi:hypothetical protein